MFHETCTTYCSLFETKCCILPCITNCKYLNTSWTVYDFKTAAQHMSNRHLVVCSLATKSLCWNLEASQSFSLECILHCKLYRWEILEAKFSHVSIKILFLLPRFTTLLYIRCRTIKITYAKLGSQIYSFTFYSSVSGMTCSVKVHLGFEHASKNDNRVICYWPWNNILFLSKSGETLKNFAGRHLVK